VSGNRDEIESIQDALERARVALVAAAAGAPTVRDDAFVLHVEAAQRAVGLAMLRSEMVRRGMA
jgi:hypothetical protein